MLTIGVTRLDFMRYPFVFYQKLDRQVYTISLGLARTEETPVLFREGKLLGCYPSLSNIKQSGLSASFLVYMVVVYPAVRSTLSVLNT